MRYLLLAFLFLALSCSSDTDTTQEKIPDQSFTESFDQAVLAISRGWVFSNQSVVLGTTNWSNPSDPPFEAYLPAGSANGYLWADYNSTTSAAGIISNWAISPELIMQNGDKISFYTRAQLYGVNGDSTDFANRLQVRLNIRNTGLDVGSGSSVGDYTELLVDINPGYAEFILSDWTNRLPDALNAFPHRWTRFEATIRGLAEPVKGRFAFRYYMEEAGNNGRGSAIGLDQVTYLSVSR